MEEKRKVERFALQIETMLHVPDDSATDTSQRLISRDISSDGVFLITNNPLPIGTRVDLDLLLRLNELNSNFKDKLINISTSGEIIRIEEGGFVVRFDKHHKVSEFEQQS